MSIDRRVPRDKNQDNVHESAASDNVKGYLRYKTITFQNQNVSSEGQL